ncbi:limbic system-associated membrane protein-like [Oratosquilla oratoria]|uniref:limbic system-associated membrane protein-like n=1 Tax=Oratosquilla oratoria TaxID=337810 RepID=UPI003F7755B4
MAVFLTLAFIVGCVCVLVCECSMGLYQGPYFPRPQPRNVTVHQSSQARLPCTVKQLGNKSVTWVRKRDADILTVGLYTFISDERFSVLFSPQTATWTLVIKFVQERDAGTYECQVSTEPKMALHVNLNVIVPVVQIVGGEEKFVRRGSTAKLECQVSSTNQLPDFIFWYHGDRRVLQAEHPRLSIREWRRGGEGSEMSMTSMVTISRVRPDDAGNYTCSPSNLHSFTTSLHVLKDEHPAAVQSGCGGGGGIATILPVLLVVLCLALSSPAVETPSQGKTPREELHQKKQNLRLLQQQSQKKKKKEKPLQQSWTKKGPRHHGEFGQHMLASRRCQVFGSTYQESIA